MAGYVYRGTEFDAAPKLDLAPAPKRKVKPIEHGTVKGFWAHYRRDEKPCDKCWRAKNPTGTNRRGIRRAAECGTASGYRRHRRQGEEPCMPCKVANSRDAVAYYHRKKEEACRAH